MTEGAPARLEIRHVASRGTSFGFATFGNGPAVMVLTPYAVPIRLQWDVIKRGREFMTAVAAAGYEVLLLDDPYGLSDTDEDVPDHFLDRQVDAALAVLDVAGIEQCHIVACLMSSILSVAFAARHPTRVSSLLLWDPVLGGGDPSKVDMWRSLGDVGAGPNVDFDARAFAGVSGATGDSRVGNDERAALRLLKGRRVGDRIMLRGLGQSEANADAARVACPALVVAPEDAVLAALEITEPVASAIPDARLLRITGAAISPALDDHRQSLPIVLDWLSTNADAQPDDDLERGRTATLTAREREVCLEAAKGQTNPQIADSLSISRWTVQRHISNAIRKTGASNRAELAALIARDEAER